MSRSWLGKVLDNTLHLRRSVCANKEVDVLLLADVNVSEEAVEESRSSGRVHAHEESCNSISECKHYKEWADWGVQFFMQFWVELDDAVCNEDVRKGYKCFAEHIEDASKSSREHEGSRMLEYQTETTESGSAEAFSSESDLAVGVHVYVLDKAVAAV